MLGHLKPQLCRLSPEAKQHYRQLYCSLCASLRNQFGLSYGLFVHHEMAISLAAFSNAAHLPAGVCACPARFFCSQKKIYQDQLVDKAARLSLLLVWLKTVDWETDRPAFYKAGFRRVIERRVKPLLADVSSAMQAFVGDYCQMIRANGDNFERTTVLSGLLARRIFTELHSDETADREKAAGLIQMLGELITIADALLDLPRDFQNREYNPIIVAATVNESPLQTEYERLRNRYQILCGKIIRELDHAGLKISEPIFAEIVLQSLANLTLRLDRAENAHFAGRSDEERNRRRRQPRDRNRFCECCEEGCDCVADGCSSCGGESCGCCEGGSCCECSC